MKTILMICIQVAILIIGINTEDSQVLVLDEIVNFSLEANTSKTYKAIINKQIKNQTKLYITAQSQFNDPYELPSMTITSDKQFKQLCYNAAAEFTDICTVPTKQLTSGRQFIIEIKCMVKCKLELSAYLNQVLKLNLGQQVIITSMDQFGVPIDIEIQIPQNITFTQILIEANIVNIDQVNEGLKLNVNYGKLNETDFPTIDDYAIKGQATWKDGLGLSLGKDSIKPGEYIKVFLYVTEKMKVKFSSQAVDGTDYALDLNQQRYELITWKQGRTYNLNLTKYLEEIKDENVDVFVDIYSGDPDIIISFDKQFPNDKIISNDYISGTINCLLTPQLRQKYNFTGMVYIKIQSFWTASYKISVWLNKKQFIPLKLQTTNINQVFKGEVKNYIYQEKLFKANNDNTKSTVLSYVVKIQMMDGNAMFGLRRCKSLESNYSLECLIKEPKQLEKPEVDKQFQEIEGQVVKSWTTYEVRFKYDFSKCASTNNTNGITYECNFQIIGTDDNSPNNSTTYAITIYKRQISILLKEGQIVKDTVEKGAYHYYMFTLPKLENISEVGFFLTTIQGDTLILGSLDYEYPALIDLGSKNISFSTHDVLIFNNLTSNVFYISVYGYETSDYTLTTVVKRYNKDKQQKQNEKSITAINLKQNVVQQYTIDKGYQVLLFSLKPTPDVPLKVTVTKKQGKIVYKVQKLVLENNQTVVVPITCLKQGDSCDFNTTKDAQEYQIVVNGDPSQTNIFTIGYSYPLLSRCSQNMMNTPIMLTVEKGKKQCLTYTLKQAKQLQILISVSSLQLMEGKIVATIKLDDRLLIMEQNSKKISVDEIDNACKLKQKFIPCQMIIEFSSMWENSGFLVVVQQVGSQMILFDGIPQKISTDLPNKQKAMYFHYQLYFESKGVKIYFSTQPTQKYTIITKIMNLTDYATINISEIIPLNSTQGPLISKRETTGEITIIKIKKKDIQSANCKQCMLAISVFKTDGVDKDRMKFKIEATQISSHLSVGDSKIGFVEEGQIYEYTVSTKDISGGIFSVNSIHNDNCVGVFLDTKSITDSSIYRSYVSLNEKDKHYQIYVKGYKQCSYQVSYSSNDKPIHQIILSLPYTITVLNSTIQYLLYYHETNQTFRIIENVISGESGIFVRPLKQKQQLSTIMKQKLQSFPFGDINGSFSDVAVSKTNDKFCFKCFYLIGIQGIPNFKGDVIVLPQGKLIPLKQNSILNDKIKMEDKQKKYVYHSINSFNITIGILFGSVQIVVESPGGQKVIAETIQNTKSFTIKHPKETEDNFIDLFDDKSKFTITITPITQSGYYIQITKKNVSQRLKEGLPTLVEITNTKQTQLQYINYNQDKTITVLIEALTTELLTPNSLTIKVELQNQDNSKKQQQPSNVVKKILQSENSYNIEMESYQSVYIIKIQSTRIQKLNISLIVVRNKLTHLISSHDNLFSHEGVFEIYHGNSSVMIQIFNCLGQVQVDASSNYSLLEDNQVHEGEIVMDKVNIGGHYVIGIEGGQPEYFLKTINQNRHKKNQQLLYLISYYIYASNQMVPYKKITTQNDKISPSIGDKSRIFSFKPVVVKESYIQKFSLKSIEYQLIISTDESLIQQYSQCSMGQAHIEKINVYQNFELEPIFKLDTETLNKIIGASVKQFYVGAIALIQLESQSLPPNYPTHLKYIYDYTQVSIAGQILPIEKQSQTYFIWIVLPFLLASLFLMLSCRYCIKRLYSTYYAAPAFVDEQDFGPSDDTFKNNDKN